MKQISASLWFLDTVEHARSVSEVKGAPDQKLLSAAWSKGRAMSLEQAIHFALEEIKI